MAESCPNCSHSPALSHDKIGCKCGCDLDQRGYSSRRIQPLKLDKGVRDRGLKIKKYAGFGFRIVSYVMLVLIVYANSGVQTLSYFIPQMQVSEEQKIQALQSIAVVSVILGIMTIFFNALGERISYLDSEDKIKQLEKRLAKLEKEVKETRP